MIIYIYIYIVTYIKYKYNYIYIYIIIIIIINHLYIYTYGSIKHLIMIIDQGSIAAVLFLPSLRTLDVSWQPVPPWSLAVRPGLEMPTSVPDL